MKYFCRYSVIDFETASVLVNGEKWKDCSNLDYEGFFRTSFFTRKIYEFTRVTKIKGRSVLIVYWANARQRDVWSCVLSSGSLLNLKGEYYCPLLSLRMERLLRSLGYRRKDEIRKMKQ